MMIRRVAEAIALQSGDEPTNWLAYRNAARAVLEAMEVPDEDMIRSVEGVPDAAAVYSRDDRNCPAVEWFRGGIGVR